MKKKKITVISLMLATAAVSAAVGGALLGEKLTASAAETYNLTDVFSTSSATVTTHDVTVDGEPKAATAFEFSDGLLSFSTRENISETEASRSISGVNNASKPSVSLKKYPLLSDTTVSNLPEILLVRESFLAFRL